MTIRLLALGLALTAPTALAQSLPDWAAPSPQAAPAVEPIDPSVLAQSEAPPPPPPPVPVDGGLALLALAGAGYAARQLRRRSA